MTTPVRALRLTILAVVVAFQTAAITAEAQVFTKNQILRLNASPATIPVSYDFGTSFAGSVPVGSPVHITYGIQVTSNNASASPVTVTIGLPAGFAPTGVKCLRYPQGTATGVPTTCTASPFNIGALSSANDKEIIVIDGHFNQAGNFTATFDASRDTTHEQTSLNMLATIQALPVDLSVTKEVKPKTGGAFGPSASVAKGSTVTFRIVVKNGSPPDPNQSTDVALGSRFRLNDIFRAPSANDVVLNVKSQSFVCAASGGADCPAVPTSPINSTVYPNNGQALLSNGFTYPSNSQGRLPAGGSFEITFDAEITTAAPCSPGQNNSLRNEAFFTYSDGANSLGDTQASNNTSTATVTVTGIPPTGCPPPPTATVLKQLLSTAAWGTPLTYLVTITNTSSQTLTGLGLRDLVGAAGTPPVTVTFAPTPSNVICTPACIATLTPSTGIAFPSISSASVFQQSSLFAPLAPGAVQTIQYDIQFDAGCSVTPGSGTITNYAQLLGPLNNSDVVTTQMPPRPACSLDVVKTQTSGPSSVASYPATVGYHVEFKNTSTTGSVTVRTLIDAIALESQIYGNLPIDYSYTCTATNVLLPTGTALTKTLTAGTVTWNNPLRAGLRLIDFSSSTGAVFSPNGVISCDVSVTLKQPSANDAFCQGDGPRDIVNSAFMDLSSPFNTNSLTPAKEKTVRVTLPKCVAISVGKTVGPNVVAGGGVTFTLTVTNAAKNGSIANITLHDNVPPSFTNVTWTCASGCAASSGTGQNINVALNPIPAGATTTIVVHANAPIVLGSYCNATNATFDPFPALSFFEGDKAALTQASACAQVESPPGLIIHKEVTGAPSGFTAQFQFTVQCTTPSGPYQKSFTVNWPTPGFVAVNDIPANSNCTVKEGPLPAAPAGYTWSGAPVYTPPGGVITIGDKGGPVSVVNKLVPQSCGRIIASSVVCEIDKNGKPTGKYVWKFRFQNLSGVPTSHLFISGLPFPVTVNDNDLEFIPAVTNLSPLNTVVFSGATPGPLTFTVSLHCGSLDDCCSFPVTLDLPPCDCAQVIGEAAPSCSFPNPKPLHYTVTLRNLSTQVVENLLVVPVSPIDHVTAVPPSAVTVTSELNPVPAAAQGGTIGPVTVTLSGSQTAPGNQVCLSLALLEKDFNHCCSIVRCFRIPDCFPNPTDFQAIGSARLANVGAGFEISNLGSSGDDGVVIDLHDADRAGLAWQPLDAAGPLPNGAFIELRAAGDAEEMKGNVRVTQSGNGRYDVTSSIDDARTYTVEIFEGTDLIDVVAGQFGIQTINVWPSAAGVELVPATRSGDPDTLAFTLQTEQPVVWVLGDGSIVAGDRIRITPEDSSGRLASLQTLELRAARIPSIVVTGVSIAHDCNGNGIFDAEEIATGAAADANGNGIPDECETAAAIDISLNTGFDQASGALLPIGTLPDGTDDDDWKVVAPAPERPAKVVIAPPPPWPAPFASTRWISLDPNSGRSPGTLQIGFERCFCLGPDTRDITLDLAVRADNEATVLLNGQTLGGPGGAFNGAPPITIHRTGTAGDGLFAVGRNCLRVNVTDFGGFTGLNAAGSVTASGNECSSQ